MKVKADGCSEGNRFADYANVENFFETNFVSCDWEAKIPKELQTAYEPITKAMANWEERYLPTSTTASQTMALKLAVTDSAANRIRYEAKYDS
jgi:hypothetical protein